MKRGYMKRCNSAMTNCCLLISFTYENTSLHNQLTNGPMRQPQLRRPINIHVWAPYRTWKQTVNTAPIPIIILPVFHTYLLPQFHVTCHASLVFST